MEGEYSCIALHLKESFVLFVSLKEKKKKKQPRKTLQNIDMHYICTPKEGVDISLVLHARMIYIEWVIHINILLVYIYTFPLKKNYDK